MQIKEFLKKYETHNISNTIYNNIRLKTILDQLSESDSPYALIADLILHYRDFKTLTLDEIQNFLDRLNLGDTDKLDKFLSSFNSKLLKELINPKITVDYLPKIPHSDVEKIIKNSWIPLEKHCYFDIGDTYYTILDKPTLDIIIEKYTLDKYKYIIDTFSCEDFAKATKAWTTMRIKNNITFANVVGNFYNKDNHLMFIHRFNIVIYFKDDINDTHVIIFEPQTDNIYTSIDDIKTEHWFKSIDNVKLKFIQI